MSAPGQFRIASPADLARMSWHQRQTYARRLEAWNAAENERVNLLQRPPADEQARAARKLLRQVIRGLDGVMDEFDAEKLGAKRAKAEALNPCGTPAAYERHRRDGDTTCPACRAAQNQDRARWPNRTKETAA